MAKVKKNPETMCWEWTGAHRGNSCAQYAAFWFFGRVVPSHKFAIEHIAKVDLAGMFACNTCGNTTCVNPDHWEACPHETSLANHAKGEDHGSAKLTDDNVRAILKSGRPAKEEAALHGVTRQTIWNIRARRNWAHVTLDGG